MYWIDFLWMPESGKTGSRCVMDGSCKGIHVEEGGGSLGSLGND